MPKKTMKKNVSLSNKNTKKKGGAQLFKGAQDALSAGLSKGQKHFGINTEQEDENEAIETLNEDQEELVNL